MKLSAPVYRLKRRARLLARELKIPLHEALDRVARGEGCQGWSHLAGAWSGRGSARIILERLVAGDLMLLGGRPGHGKTLLGAELAAQAARSGWSSFFFSLEDNEQCVRDRLRASGPGDGSAGASPAVDTSDEICASYIARRFRACGGRAFAVVDYLQLLDQQRSKPDLATQLVELSSLARETSSILILLSQIDRAFDPGRKRLPDLSDVRSPNPIDLALFTKSCFLHDGQVRISAATG